MAQRYAALVAERSAWIDACLAAPASCEGRRVFLSLVEVVSVDGDRYTVRKVVKDIPVQGDASRRRVGSTISLVARFDADAGGLVEQTPQEHPLRGQKRRLGIAGLLMVVVAAAVAFRPTRRGLALRG